MSLSTNSALTEYEGPSRGRRQRGSVRVQEPAFGFFIAGSNIDEMNGIFGRVRNEHARFLTKHPVHLCYKHDNSGWLMALIETPKDELELEKETLRYTYEKPCDTQWCFISKDGRDRFKHKGDTIVPGAGTRWKFVHRGAEKAKASDSETDDDSEDDDDSDEDGASESAADKAEKRCQARGEIVEVKEDDDDDLPWQVIALLDENILRDLRWSNTYREKRVALALKGLDVEQPEESTIEGFLQAELAEMRAIEGGGVGLSSRRSSAPRGGGEGGEGDDEGEATVSQAAGWLYRVTTADGVKVYMEPFDDDEDDAEAVASGGGGEASSPKRKKTKQRKVGSRSEGDYVRVIEVQGRWLRLAPTEKARRDPPLALGDLVMVSSGQYRGERGEVARKLDEDTREFGVKLKGYTGTGSFHISELKRDGAAAGSKKAREAARKKKADEARQKRTARQKKREEKAQQKAVMRQYYGDSYADFMSSSEEESDSEDDSEDDDENIVDDRVSSDDDNDYDESYRGPLWIAMTELGARRRKKHEPATAAPPLLLMPVPIRDMGSLKTGVEKEEADLYDRPFEPRIEGSASSEEASSSSSPSSTGLTMDGMDELEDEEEGATSPDDSEYVGMVPTTLASPLLTAANAPVSTPSNARAEASASAAAAADGTNGEDAGAIPVGSSVMLQGLKTQEYNGRKGVVITKSNKDGRYGIRLDPLRSEEDGSVRSGSDKKLLLKPENIAACDSSSGTGGVSSSSGEASEQQSNSAIATCMNQKERDEVERAARVLNVRLDAIGLGPLIAQPVDMTPLSIDQDSSREVLNALLRAADRDNNSQSSPSSGAAQRMQSEAVVEAKKAHSILKKAVKTASAAAASAVAATPPAPSAGDGSSPFPPPPPTGAETGWSSSSSSSSSSAWKSLCYGMAPHLAVEKGFLGERAGAAALLATDASSFDRIQGGLAALESLLADEQARLVRERAEWTGGGMVGGKLPMWRLEQAEKASATSVFEDIGADDEDDLATGGSSADDCLRLRLTIVRALLRCHRDADAALAAETAAKIHPQSAAALLWHGRCLLRSGQRTEGLRKLSNCVALGPEGGAGGAWAYKEAATRLRALRRALKGEIRAKDAYERAKFSEAADVYSEMMKEYEGQASDDKWGRAEALVARAACFRRDRKLDFAIADCDQALAIFPRYPRALFRRSVCLMEKQQSKEAQQGFERLLRVDRKWPKLLDWLIRAAAQVKRHAANGGKKSGDAASFEDEEERADGAPTGNEDFYSVLGVSTDATEAQLKRAYRLRSLKVHPDKKGGSVAAFQLVATAYETLSNPQKRQLYDDGVDVNKKKKKKKKNRYGEDESSDSEDEDGNKKKSLREEIERKYFPENFKFWPFGDPFVEKRRHDAKKKKKAEEAKARKSMGGSGRRQPVYYGDY